MADSVTAVLNNYDVYQGVWTNYARRGVAGATITVIPKHGALLIAFLALYVQLVGTRVWRISSFALHQILSGNAPDDGYYHQRQVVLRNVGTDWSSLFEFLRIGWAWRSKTRHSIARILPLCLVALFNIAVFTVAGIFSSYVTDTTGNEVLLSTAHGGFLNRSQPYNLALALQASWPYNIGLTQAATAYAQQCFNSNATSQACSAYVKPSFRSAESSIPCPLGDDLCVGGTAFRIDSGPLDSQLDFGINAKPEDRFTWRTITTCAVLKTDGYTREIPDLDFNLTQYPKLLLNYGSLYNPNTETYVSENYTYSYHTAFNRQHVGIADYILIDYSYNAGVPPVYNWWRAIPALNITDADGFIYFLSASGVGFIDPVDDAWFSAHQYNNDSGYYLMDRAVSPLVCHAQYQFCNPNRADDVNGGCSPLDGAYPTAWLTSDTTFWSSPAQMTSAFLFAEVVSGFTSVDISQFVSNLGSAVLLARNVLSAGSESGPLPKDQWQFEVKHWHDTVLALIQRLVVEQATGPSDPVMNQFVQQVNQDNPVTCQPQIVRSDEYTSFSVLGLSLVIGIGAVLILLSFLIEPCVGCLQRRSYTSIATQDSSSSSSSVRTHIRRAEWLSDQKFQLQRMAFEGAGSGPWIGGLDMVPTTAQPGERLPRLDLTSIHHPSFKAVGREMKGLAAGNATSGNLKGTFSSKGLAVDTTHYLDHANVDSESAAKLRLNTYSPLSPGGNTIGSAGVGRLGKFGFDDDTSYAASTLGMPTPALETPRSGGLGPFSFVRGESWRSPSTEKEREYLVRHNDDIGRSGLTGYGGRPGLGSRAQTRRENETPSAPYVDVTRDIGDLD